MKKTILFSVMLLVVVAFGVQYATTKADAAERAGRVSGIIQEGVEGPSCKVLNDECTGTAYLLVGDLNGFTIRDHVCVIGRPIQNFVSFCQQGQPLGVIHISEGPCPGGCPGN